MSINNLSTAVSERTVPQLASLVGRAETSNENGQSRSDVQPAQRQTTERTQGLQVVADNQARDAQPSVEDRLNGQVANAQEGATQAQQKPTEEELARSLEQVSESSAQLSSMQIRKLEFTAAQESGRVVVKVIDKESNDVIRQIPSEEFIKVAKRINDLSNELDSAQGLLFESKA